MQRAEVPWGRKTDARTVGGVATQTTSYSYDALGRLAHVGLPSGVSRDYSYDLDSNCTAITENGSQVASYAYDPATTAGVDELTSVTKGGTTTNYRYSSDGQVKSRGADTISWDGWGRMSGGSFNGSSLSYGFDASGAWRSRSSAGKTTRYLLGDDFETDGTGTLTASYTPGPAGDLAQYSGPPAAGTAVSFLYYDDHGNLVAEANGTGTRTAAHTYDPFGAPLDTQPANDTVHRFTGRWDKQYDTSSQLIQMGARPYDPALGRFLAMDAVEGGSLNSYDYSGQDPVNGFDLDGRTFIADGANAGARSMSAEAAEALERAINARHPSCGVCLRQFVHLVVHSACFKGAVVAAVTTGPEDALGGCLVGTVIDAAEHSRHRMFRIAGTVADALSVLRDFGNMSAKYARLASEIENDIAVAVKRLHAAGAS